MKIFTIDLGQFVADKILNRFDVVAGSGFSFGKFCNIGVAEVIHGCAKPSGLLFGYVAVFAKEILVGKQN